MTWTVECYPSGTMVVVNRSGNPRAPHFYVYGPGGGDETHSDRNRHRVCEDIAAYMNGGDRPAWLDDMQRVTETHAESMDRTRITATGPSIDIDPPRLNWVQDDSDEAKSARARLMDALFFPRVDA